MKLADSIDKYVVYELQGKGGFAEVYRAVELETGTEVAIKKISKQSVTERNMWNRVKQELAIHSVLEHPSIVKVYTCFQDDIYIYLVLEYCSNGELRKLLEERNAPFNENQARSVLKQVLSGLKYLHSHRIIHRDLTLSNLLLTREWAVKIADFGLAVKFSQPDEKHKTMCGTPNYIAPEVVTRKDQGPETDIWNVGILMYTLLVGKPPFDSEYGGVKTTLKNVVTADITWPSYLSSEVVHLMDSMLQKLPEDRITLKEILNHPFVVQSTCQDLRMLTPAVTSNLVFDDSGFMTNPSSWLATSGATASFRRPTSQGQLHRSQPLRPVHPSATTACSHAANFCVQCSHVENCTCCLLSRLSFNNGLSNHNFNCSGHQTSGCVSVKSVDPGEKKKPGPIMVRTLPPDIPVPPLNTTRLVPKLRVPGKSVYFSILETGEVVLEFFKERHQAIKIIEVMLISSDGLTISLQHPYEERHTKPGGGVTYATYTYENLPERFLKKYLYALKCVNNEKAVTSKITYYSPLAKCHLMENQPDPNFTVQFYSGGKIIKKGSTVEMLDTDYNVVGKHPLNFRGDGLEPPRKLLWTHFQSCWEECSIKEKYLEELSSRNRYITWFPNISGQKPRSRFGNADKENHAIEKATSVMSQRVTGSAPSSLAVRHRRPSSSQSTTSRHPKVFKTVSVPHIGTAYQMTNGLVSVHYWDKSKLDVQPSSSSRKTTLFKFTDGITGAVEEYRVDSDGENNYRIPDKVREKIVQYGAMVEKLKDS